MATVREVSTAMRQWAGTVDGAKKGEGEADVSSTSAGFRKHRTYYLVRDEEAAVHARVPTASRRGS
jgi:hypothetical protein